MPRCSHYLEQQQGRRGPFASPHQTGSDAKHKGTQVECSFYRNFPRSGFYCLSAKSSSISAQSFGQDTLERDAGYSSVSLPQARLLPVSHIHKMAQVVLMAFKFFHCLLERVCCWFVLVLCFVFFCLR